MTTIVSGSQITFNDNTTQNTSAYGGGFAFRNRIINGDMRIDQRNAGASVTQNTSGIYTVDRWVAYGSANSKFTVQRNAGSVTPPAGFTNYAGCTSSSAYTVGAAEEFDFYQYIEGYNIADLAWGTANAKTVTLSFWVRSSLTGTFGAQIANYNSSRSYPFSYTISSANTWEQKTVTITGDTTGTWYTDNSAGMLVNFSLGAGSSKSGTANTWQAGNYTQPTGSTSVVGTNGATFYITGVQLEKGSTATSFDYRPYGQELALCQRYYEKSYNVGTAPATVTDEGRYILQGSSDSGNNLSVPIFMQVSKRTTPTFTGYIASTGASGSWFYARNGASGNATVTFINIGTQLAQAFVNVGSAWVACYAIGHWTASAEL